MIIAGKQRLQYINIDDTINKSLIHKLWDIIYVIKIGKRLGHSQTHYYIH